MDPPRARRRPIDILQPTEVLALMQQCSRRAPTGVRNRALIALLYGSGLRISEALSLRPRDLDLDGLSVTIHNGKGDQRRVSALMLDAVDSVQRWLDRRRELGIGPQHVIFCTVSRGAAGPHPTVPGGRLTREYVARFLRKVARKAGIEKRIHAHGFRHSHADLLRRRGFDVEEIRVQLGHRNLEVTSTYLDHLGANDLPDRMRELGSVLEPQQDARLELEGLLSDLGQAEVARIVGILKTATKLRPHS